MKLLFVVPPYRTTDRLTSALYPMPYAAVSLAAVLEAAGHEVEIKDFLIPRQESAAKAPESFAGFRHPAYRHFGVPLEEAIAWLDGNVGRFDAVGLCSCQCNIWETIGALGRAIKKQGVPLVLGGPFASTAPDQVIGLTGADVIVRGEAEERVVEAFEAAADGGRTKILDGTVVKLGKLPLPAWHLAPPSDYPRVEGRIRGVLCASRGCPWDCEFCSVRSIMSRKHRRMPRARVLAELRQLYELGVRYFSFLDDNLFMSPKATEEIVGILEELRAQDPGWARCRFYVEEGIEVRVAAEPGLLRRAADIGFENLALGLETLNATVRQEAKKPYTEEHLERALAECKTAGITPRAFYIIGFPGETVSSVARDLVSFGRLGLAARPNNLKVYPGTELASRYHAAGWIDVESYDWRRSSWHTPESDGLRFDEIVKLKTVLGAIGFAAETFGIRLLLDSTEEIREKLAAKKYRLTELRGGSIRIAGNLYRATPYRHMAILLVLRGGAAGATVKVEKARVTARPAPEPADEIQAAIGRAIRGEADPPAPEPPSEMQVICSADELAEVRIADARELEVEPGSVRLVVAASVYLGKKARWPEYEELYRRVYVERCVPALRQDGYFVLIQTDAYEAGRVFQKNALVSGLLSESGLELIDRKIWQRERADHFQPPFSEVYVYRVAGDATSRKRLQAHPDYFRGVWDYPQAAGGPLAAYPPGLCRLLVEAFTDEGDLILDPFAGTARLLGVAAALGRRAIGYEIDGGLVETIEQSLGLAQAEAVSTDAADLELQPGAGVIPQWCVGDARHLDEVLPSGLYDLIFTCPPYYDLERYTDDPADLSAAESYETFLADYQTILEGAARQLRPDRFAVIVVGEIRDEEGRCRGFVSDTIRLAEKAGLSFYNDVVLVTAHGSLPVRAGRAFEASRKLGKTHQNVLVFVKGDWRKATAELGSVEFGKGEELTEADLEPPVV